VAQIAYLGDTSRVYLETDSGLRITCNRQNQSRAAADPLAVGARCWAAFDPADSLLLPE